MGNCNCSFYKMFYGSSHLNKTSRTFSVGEVKLMKQQSMQIIQEEYIFFIENDPWFKSQKPLLLNISKFIKSYPNYIEDQAYL